MTSPPVQDRFRWRIPRNVWLDTAVLLGLLSAANLLLAPRDFGWLMQNPSPYVLLPILMGCRYGPLPGILSGLAGVGLVAAVQSLALGVSASLLFERQFLFIIGIPVVGAVCGEAHAVLHRRELQLQALNEQLQSRLRQTNADLFLLGEAKAELERLLATRDSELSTIDSEIRRLMEADREEVFGLILLLLNRQARISDAAIYLTGPNDTLVRKALLGRAQGLPETLATGAVGMIALALSQRTPVSIPEFWQRGTPADRDYLAAFPILDSEENPLGVLVVTDMPFIALNRRTIQLVSLICRWAARVIDLHSDRGGAYRTVGGTSSQRVYTREFFRDTIDLAYQSYQIHGLPSSVVLVELEGADKSRQDALERAVLTTVRAGDYPAELSRRGAHLAVLLPLTGDRGASIFVERVLGNVSRNPELAGSFRHRTILFSEAGSAAAMWDLLEGHEP